MALGGVLLAGGCGNTIGDTLAMKVNAALAALTVADVLMAGR